MQCVEKQVPKKRDTHTLELLLLNYNERIKRSTPADRQREREIERDRERSDRARLPHTDSDKSE